MDDEEDETSYMDNTRDLMMEELLIAANQDPQYQDLRTKIANGFEGIRKSTDLPEYLRPYFKIRTTLSDHKGLALYGNRVIIPTDQRQKMLARLHLSHQGIVKTLRRARSSIFWPGISSDVKNIIAECDTCQEGRPSLAPESLLSDPMPTKPFQETSADLFEYAKHQYMIYVDRFSNWIEVRKFGPSPDSDKVIDALMDVFARFGVPLKFRTDGGLQFASAKTQDFCKRWGVRQVFSAPHYSQSNGLAESAVKAVKKLLTRAKTHEEFQMGLLELMNTPGKDDLSPAVKVFGRQTRSVLPSLNALPPTTFHRDSSVECAQHRDHPVINPGQQVRLQDPATHKWNRIGTVKQRMGRNYVILCHDTNHTVVRNRRHLLPCAYTGPQIDEDRPRDSTVRFQPLRRSSRIKQRNQIN
jgi:hypothetical protein